MPISQPNIFTFLLAKCCATKVSIIFAFCISLLCTPALLSATPLPDMGNSFSQYLSPAQERALGQAVMREIRQKLPIITDPEINSYLQSLGNKLVNYVDSPPHEFTFFAISDPSLNAFATPGGYIGVHTGLILAADSESELASVIAHEIGHITQSHFARRIEELKRMTLPRAAAFITGILLAGIDPELGYATLIAADAAAIERQLGFSRDHEREADRTGLNLLARAGFNPVAAISFLRKLQTISDARSQPIEFLLTHPLTEARLADLQNRVRLLPPQPHQDSLEFALIRATLKVISQPNPAVALQNSLANFKQNPKSVANRYQLAVAYLHHNELDKAAQEFTWLLENDNQRLAYYTGLLKSLVDTPDLQASHKIFHEANRLHPNHPVLLFHYCNNLTRNNKADDAFHILRRYLLTNPATPELYQLAARSAANAGKEGAGHRYLAEYYFERAYYRLALEHLDKAIDISWKQPIEAEGHQARKKEVEQFVGQRLDQRN